VVEVVMRDLLLMRGTIKSRSCTEEEVLNRHGEADSIEVRHSDTEVKDVV